MTLDLAPAVPAPAATGLSPQERVMARLRQLYQDVGLVWVLSAAETVIDELYDGRLDRYHERNRYKDEPFEALLADHADELAAMRLSAPTLRHYIRAWEVHRGLPADLQGRLTAAHLGALAGLPGTAEQAEMAREAVERGWTTEELQSAVAERQAELFGEEPRLGRPRLSDEVKAARATGRKLVELETLCSQRGTLATLPLGERVQLRQELEAVQARAAELLRDLGE